MFSLQLLSQSCFYIHSKDPMKEMRILLPFSSNSSDCVAFCGIEYVVSPLSTPSRITS